VASSTDDAPWWQYVVGFIFGFFAAGAYEFGVQQQRDQSGDPTR
jgi:uncharacterized membrane protein